MPPVKTPRLSFIGVVLLAAVAFVLGSGCAAMRVKPWDRDLLAEPEMRFNPQPMENAVDEHIYFSKEASTGGDDLGGGGCGCN
jgi:hypothetical protein